MIKNDNKNDTNSHLNRKVSGISIKSNLLRMGKYMDQPTFAKVINDIQIKNESEESENLAASYQKYEENYYKTSVIFDKLNANLQVDPKIKLSTPDLENLKTVKIFLDNFYDAYEGSEGSEGHEYNLEHLDKILILSSRLLDIITEIYHYHRVRLTMKSYYDNGKYHLIPKIMVKCAKENPTTCNMYFRLLQMSRSEKENEMDIDDSIYKIIDLREHKVTFTQS